MVLCNSNGDPLEWESVEGLDEIGAEQQAGFAVAINTTSIRNGVDSAIIIRGGVMTPEDLARNMAQVRPARSRRDSRRSPGRSVGAVVMIACKILPAAHRRRYVEECRAELFDLPRRSRPGYVLRLLVSTPALRRGLADQPNTTAAAEEPSSP
jgi:hypothetical protein